MMASVMGLRLKEMDRRIDFRNHDDGEWEMKRNKKWDFEKW